ncbi:MAG: AAA family ATPase [Gaiellales bacterium]
MIVRVEIENLVIVERAVFEPGTGLTAVTGETGAGKTLLATAIGLLFGGDADAAQVGPNGSQAWIEGEFDVDEAFWARPELAAFTELRPEPDAPLVLARRVDANGRSRALAWGRTITKSDLAAAGKRLVVTAGQHVQVRLRSAEYQRSTLDAAGDAAHAALLAQMADTYATWSAAAAELARIEQLARDGAGHQDQLRDDLERIDAVAPSVEEEQTLIEARDRARHHATIVEALSATSAVLDGGEASAGGAIDLAGRAYATLAQATEVDRSLVELAEQLLAAQDTLTEIASEIGSRLGDLADGPGSLDEIEGRLSAYDEVKRRFGGTVEAVLAAAETMREQLATIDDSSGALAAATAAAAAAHTKATRLATKLTAARLKRAEHLTSEVHASLTELGMAGSVFRVALEDAPLAAHGADKITLLLAPAADIEPRPVAQVASGGELSRIALALFVATASEQGSAGTILFDEIDAGIGGHTAHAVATMLRRLADRRQVVCITHLPQVAARADAHVVIEKADLGGGVRTTLDTLHGEPAVIEELARMLGAGADDDAAREHARQLRGPRFLASAAEPAAVDQLQL